MRGYVGRRLLQTVPVLFLATIVAFGFVRLLPGDPATVLGGSLATPDQISALRHSLGLDRPLPYQYLVWLQHAVTGNLGYSYSSDTSVSSQLAQSIPATAQLAVASLVISLLIALPLGVVGAIRPRSLLGRIGSLYRTLGLAVPSFWLAILSVLFLAVQHHVFPAISDYVPFGTDPGRAFLTTLLPAFAIGFHVGAVTARYITAALSETMSMDFVRTVRAKGASETRVILAHALRNALLPVVTVVGLQLGALLGGAIVIEVVFNYPGVGRLIYRAVSNRDYVLVQGSVLFVTAVFIVINLVVDIVYAYLAPCIQLG